MHPTSDPAPLTPAAVDELGRATTVVLTTYKRDGTPVPTPIWINVVDGRILLTTTNDSGKVKRIRNSATVDIATSTRRGAPTGPTYRATATLVDGDLVDRAIAAKRKRYTSFRLIVRLRGGVDKQAVIAVDPPAAA